MKDKLEEIRNKFLAELKAATSLSDIDQIEIAYLGRKAGEVTMILRGLKDLPESDRRVVGPIANQLRQEIESEIGARKHEFDNSLAKSIDVTLPGASLPEGHLHLVTQAIREIVSTFERIGFVRRRYPEIEWDWYAFESLNMPPDHPARDEWETFFIDTEPIGKKGQRILTPHSTSGDVREMEKGKLPIRSVNIAKCFRRQIDISHVPMFHQFDGLLIDRDVTIAHLIGTLDYFAKNFFGPTRRVRIRPFHFQFTEPSFEVDISCGVCDGKGCKLCKAGWLELGGAGMVHPNVLKAGKIDPNKYSGFAFGWGVERCYMMKEGLSVPDIRILYENDVRFLRQF